MDSIVVRPIVIRCTSKAEIETTLCEGDNQKDAATAKVRVAIDRRVDIDDGLGLSFIVLTTREEPAAIRCRTIIIVPRFFVSVRKITLDRMVDFEFLSLLLDE